MITDSVLMKYDLCGLIPASQETEEVFLQRISPFIDRAPIHEIPEAILSDWQAAQEEVFERYGFTPSWIELVCSNEGLMPWHGGALAWDDKDLPFIQLHPRFKKQKALSYKAKEILSHEGCHSGRLGYEPGLYEEFLCYQLSPHAWRRFLGPFFSHSPYCWTWIGCSLGIICFNILFQPWGVLLCSLGIVSALLHYFAKYQQFTKGISYLKGIVGEKLAWIVAFRLNEKELFRIRKAQSLNFLIQETGPRARLLQLLLKMTKTQYNNPLSYAPTGA